MTQAGQESVPSGNAGAAVATAKVSLWMVLVILLLSLGLRAGYVLQLGEGLEFPDERQYLNIAQNFLNGHGLAVSIDSQTEEPLHEPLEIHRMPMYPLVLALIEKAAPGVTSVRLLQALLGALSCVMIYLLAAELAGERAGCVAALLASVDPFSIYFAGRFLSETLFVLLLVTCWYYVVRTWKEVAGGAPASRWLASSLIAGLVGAVAVLTRSTLLPVFLLLPFVWLAVGPRRIRGFAVGLLILLVVAVGLLPWVARNYKRTWDKEAGGRLVVTTLNVGESLYEAVGPFATGGPNKENTVWPVELTTSNPDEYTRNQFLVQKSLAYMVDNPARTLRLAGKKLLRTWNVTPNYESIRTPLYMTVSLAWCIPVFLTAILGFLVSLRRFRTLAWLLLPVLVFTLIHMVFVGSVRYRVPVMPFVEGLSGMGIWWGITKVFKRTRGTVESKG
jgi:4-amino-4-deoxy-L-arabinose transferase-like glycosyltransferase